MDFDDDEDFVPLVEMKAKRMTKPKSWNSTDRNGLASSRSGRSLKSKSNYGDDDDDRSVPTKRTRWIEERSKQQELAHLVSKAKQANQARLYQNEIEKHVSMELVCFILISFCYAYTYLFCYSSGGLNRFVNLF